MQTIGERLEDARKKRGLSIREAAEATKIRGDYLTKFENNQFDINLTELYVRGFLRTYANFLKIPSDKILNDYAALGHGQPRPRQPSREVYGRMDLSIASADARTDPEPEPVEPTPASAPPRRHPGASRATTVTTGSSIDPALVFKGLKWAGLAVIVLLIVWGIKAIVGGEKSSDRAKATTTASVPAADPTITLYALDTVRVSVERKNADNSHGDILFQGTLVRGQNQVVSKPGPIYITASAAENLEIEYRGKRYPTGQTGNMTLQMK